MPSSRPVDEVIAKLTLETGEFQRSAYEAIGTFNKLKTELSSDIKDNLSSMAAGIDKIASRFDFLGTLQQRLMWRVSDSIINAGQDIFRTATAAIRDGWGEYNTKMNSIMTMKANGYAIEDISKNLKVLNDYADKTIFSFSDMTSAMSQFTSKGVDLETASKAVMGMSNAAGLNNASNTDLRAALYNLSQALSAGYMSSIDWKTMDTRNISSIAMKKDLAETAVALGTLQKQADGTYKTLEGKTYRFEQLFKDALQDRWMNNDVMLKSFEHMADESTEIGKAMYEATTSVKTWSQMVDTVKEDIGSGWAETFEILVGNLDEATALFTGIKNEISSIVGPIGNFRNEMLLIWKEFGGRNDVLEGLANIYQSFKVIVEAVVNAFRDVFAPNTRDSAMFLADISSNFKKLTGVIKTVASVLANLIGPPVRIIFSLLKVALSPLRVIHTIITKISTALSLLAAPLSKINELIGIILDPFNQLISAVANFNLDGIKDAFSGIKKLFKPWTEVTKELTNSWVRLGRSEENGGTGEGWHTRIGLDMHDSVISEWIKKFGSGIRDQIRQAFIYMSNIPDSFLNSIGKTGLKIFDTFAELVKGSGGLIFDGLYDILGVIFDIIGAIGGGLWRSLRSIYNFVKSIFAWLTGKTIDTGFNGIKLIASILHGIADAIRFVFNVAYGAVSWVKGTVLNVISTLGKKLEGLWNTLKGFIGKSGFISNLKNLGKYLSVVGNAIKDGGFNFLDLKSLQQSGMFNGDIFGSLMNLAGSTISSGFDAIKNFIFSLLPPDIAKELDAFGTALYNAVAPPVQDAWNFMVGLVTDFGKSMDSAKQAVTDFLGEHETLRKAFESIKNVLTEVWEHIVKYYDAFKAGGFGEMFSTMGEDVKTAFQFVKEFLDAPASDNAGIFADLSAGAQAFASISWESISQAVHDIVKSLTSPEMKDLVNMALQLTGIFASVKIATKLGGLLDALKDLAALSDPLGSVEQFGNRLIGISKTFSGRVLSIAILAFGLSSLAKAFVELSKVPWQSLAVAAGVMVAVFAAVGFIAHLLGDKIQNLFALGMLGFAFLGLAASFAIIVGCAELLGDAKKWDTFQNTMIAFLGFIGVVTLLSTWIEGGQLLMAAASLFLFAVGFAAVVASIVGIYALVKQLKDNIDPQAALITVVIVAVIVAVTIAVAALIGKMAKAMNKSNFALALVGVAAMFYAISIVIEEITNAVQSSWGNTGAMTGMLKMLTLVFVGVAGLIWTVALAGNYAENAKASIKQIGLAMVGIGFALLGVAEAIKIVSEMKDIWAAIKTATLLILFVGAIVGIGYLLSKSPGAMSAMYGMAASLTALAISAILLSGLDAKALDNALRALVGFLSVLLIFAFIAHFEPIAAGLALISGALMSFAFTVGTIAVVLVLFAAIVYAIVHSADNMTPEIFIAKLTEFVDEICAYAVPVGQQIGRAIGALLAGLFWGLVSGIQTLFSGIIQGAQAYWGPALEGIGNLFKKGLEAIGKKIGEAFQSIKDGIIGFFQDPIGSITDMVGGWFGGDDGEGAADAAYTSASKPFEKVKQANNEKSAEAAQSTQAAVDAVEQPWDNFDIAGIEDLANRYGLSMDNIVGKTEGLSDVNAQLSQLTSMDFSNMQTQTVDASSMIQVTGLEEVGGQSAQTVVDSMTSGLTGNTTAIQGGVDVLTAAADEQWAHFDWASTGSHAADGLAAGLSSSNALDKVKSAARALAQAAVDEANATVESHSPSRVFMRIGGYIWQGFVNGIGDGIDRVKAATHVLAQAAVDTAQTAMDAMAMRPTVTPVLDISNLEKIPGVGTGLEIPIRADIRGLGSDIDGMTNKIVNSNKSVTTKINELIDKLESVELKIALQPQELDGNVITDTVEEITSIRKLLSDFGKGEA